MSLEASLLDLLSLDIFLGYFSGKAEEAVKSKDVLPHRSPELSRMRRELAPKQASAFHEFSQKTFEQGALSSKMKQIIAVAVAHVTQCPYCIRGHTKAALRHGASREELMEAIWVAAEMRAGGAFAHSVIALDEMLDDESESGEAHHEG